MTTHLQRFYEVEDSTIKRFNDVYDKLAMPIRLEFKIYGDSKLKKLIEIKKASPDEEFIYKTQIRIKFNEDLLNLLDEDESVDLLIRECLNGLEVNTQTGVIKIKKPDMTTFTSIMEKYTLEKVKRAKELEKTTLEQISDKELESEAI